MGRLRVLTYASALSALACDGDPIVAIASSAPNDTVRVIDLSFRPDSLHVNTGDAVVFMNVGITHDVLFVGLGSPQDIPRGVRWIVERRFSLAGRVSYLCSIHPTMGGVIHVRPGR